MITRRQLAALTVGAAPLARAQSSHGEMLWSFMREYVRILDEHRAKKLAAIRSEEDLARLRDRVRSELTRMWGPFPERTPFNAQQIGAMDRGDHLVERIVFESRPKFFVTANVYRPKDKNGPLPAVLFVCGHAAEGKAGESYQRMGVLLARSGLIALVCDPLGQGERSQFPTESDGAPTIAPGSAEHRVLGHQCYLLGENLMQYRAWDAVRALDYLEVRPDVAADRIGIAGQSGGGMVTLQFAGLDDRIKAAFASCAVASFRAKSEALLLADPEQILYGTLRAGIDHPELLSTLAPRPLLIGAALRDYVPIDSARRTYQELQGVYRAVGAESAVSLVETDAGHGLNHELREAAARFFVDALGGGQAVSETEVELPTVEELSCTDTGQVATAFGSVSLADLNATRAREFDKDLPPAGNAGEFEVYRNEVANRARAVTRAGAPKAEHGIDVPGRFRDAGVYAKGTVFLVAEQGIDHPVVQRYCIDGIVAADYSAHGLDLRGWGATAPRMPYLDVSFSWDDFLAYRALELGRPMLGQRIKDLLSSTPRLTKRRGWVVIGIGAGGLVAAHAAAMDERITAVVSIEAPLSFREMVEDPRTTQPVSSMLPGVLRAYEIRDLYASTAPRPLLIINPQDSRRKGVSIEKATREMAELVSVYEMLDAEDNIRLQTGVGRQGLRTEIGDFLTGLSA